MNVKTNPIKPLCLFTLLSFSGMSLADVFDHYGSIINNPVVDTGQKVTIKQMDTANFGTVETASSTYNYINGNLVNYGQMFTWSSVFVGKAVLDNYGNLFVNQALSILGFPEGGKIINHSGGHIVLNGYMDLYSYASVFENAGRVTILKSVGHGIADDRVGVGHHGFTTEVLRGSMRNTGSFIIDNNIVENNCSNSSNPFSITNEGLFEIGSGSVCDFATSPAQPISQTGTKYPRTGTSYTQVSGETVVNGTFGVHTLSLRSGKLSGNGTVNRTPLVLGRSSLIISPGSQAAPVGTLTLIPEQGYSIFSGTVSIELSAKGNDVLQVQGDVQFSGLSRLHVTVNGDLLLKKGQSFTIIKGNNVYESFTIDDNAFLPPLRAGQKWQIVNDGVSVKLNVI